MCALVKYRKIVVQQVKIALMDKLLIIKHEGGPTPAA